jgi:prephenate dehydrogenase
MKPVAPLHSRPQDSPQSESTAPRALPLFKQMTIVGVGLIGGSLGMICKRKGLVESIIGAGRREENLRKAIELKAIDRYSHDLREAASGSDLLILATPVDSFESALKTCGPVLAPGAIVTDVGSVKGPLVGRMESLVPSGVSVVGAHPIAGKEKTGVAAASMELFHGARCILTPTPRSNPDAIARIRFLWEATGARVSEMDPDLHDRVLGAVSHLPHVVAFALVNAVAALQDSHSAGLDLQAFAGAGYRDTTRIAASSPEMWRDICLWNRDNIVSQIELYQACLDKLKALIKAGDAAALIRELERVKERRESIM